MRKETWSACLRKYYLLKETETLSVPFAGYTSPNFANATTKILYVGKATRGDFRRNQFDLMALESDERAMRFSHEVCREVFESNVGRAGASFWGFANDLANRLNGRGSLDTLSWSNLCRLGSSAGNPHIGLIEAQSDESTLALREDIADLKPNLVVFVSNNYAKSILMGALGNPEEQSWEKSDKHPDVNVRDVWWKEHREHEPALLWMRHPQFSKAVLRDFALSKAEQLASNLLSSTR